MAFDFLGFSAGSSVIVTGAASGIGAATAQMLCTAGLTVIGVDIDADRLHDLDLGPAFRPHVFHTGEPETVATHMARIAAEHGPILHLVNNAGPPSSLPLTIEEGLAQTAGSVQRVTAAWAAALPEPAAHASLVNVASVAGAIAGTAALAGCRARRRGGEWLVSRRQGRHRRDDPLARRIRGRPLSRQRRCPRHHPHPRLGDITAGAYGRDVLRARRWAGSARRRTWRARSCSCSARRRPSSTARRSSSTAAAASPSDAPPSPAST